MSGKSNRQKQLEQQQDKTTSDLLSIAKTQQTQGTQELAQRNELRQPFIDQQKALASGNMNAIRTAASPVFGQIEAEAQAQANQVRNTLTGASRDFALAEVNRGKTSSIYDFIRKAYLQAPANLAALGTENAGVGQGLLQGATGALSGGINAMSNQQQLEAQRRAQSLGLVSNLFNFAGMAAGGFGK
jgi:hypothetical protein